MHAYLIIAHTDLYCLERLIKMLDDERNDIFLLIDKRSKIKINFTTQKSRLYEVPRINIYWGDVSQVKAELHLMEFASKKGNYEYYHLLSGQDLPIKTQNYIHSFFDSLPKGANLVDFTKEKNREENIRNRTQYYTFFTKKCRVKNIRIRKFYDMMRGYGWAIQRRINRHRKFPYSKMEKGANWFSLTEECVTFLLSRKKIILKYFSFMKCSDEVFIQTELYNNNYFRNTLINQNKEFWGCFREIDWERGGPYIWRMNDFNQLMASKNLFARKFSSVKDKEIIDLIYSTVTNIKD